MARPRRRQAVVRREEGSGVCRRQLVLVVLVVLAEVLAVVLAEVLAVVLAEVLAVAAVVAMVAVPPLALLVPSKAERALECVLYGCNPITDRVACCCNNAVSPPAGSTV